MPFSYGTLGVRSVKLGVFTKNLADASGLQSITGVGFMPVLVFFLGIRYDVSSPEVSIGFDDVSQHFGIANNHEISPNNWAQLTVSALDFRQGIGNTHDMKLNSLDADGFTVSWTKAGAPSGNARIFYLAMR